MGKKLLSVIVPVYNVRNYIKECIESIITQTLKQIEVILVDDGSTDGSGELCDEYAQKDSRIVVIHQKNMGLIRARYNGLKVSTCEYVTFVDGDDFIAEHSYELAVSSMKESIDMIVFGSITYFDRDYQKKNTCNLPEGTYSRGEIEEKLFHNMIWDYDKEGFGLEPSLCFKIIKRGIIISGYSEIKNMVFHYGEDAAITYPLLLNSINTLRIINQYYYYYRQRDKHVIPSYLTDKNFFSKLLILYEYLISKANNNKEIEKQIDYFYIHFVNLRKRFYEDCGEKIKYVFPFHKVEKGKRIVLYAAGTVGQIFYQQVKCINYCDIVAWVDKNYEKYNVESVEKILSIQFDYIVVAVDSKSISLSIKANLLDMGICNNKIIEI